MTLDLPLVDLSTMAPAKPVQSWSPEEVSAWIGAAEGGRFAHVALPPGLDGAGLMKLGTMRLSQLFDVGLREARGNNEGLAWTEVVGTSAETGEGSGATEGLFSLIIRRRPDIFLGTLCDDRDLARISCADDECSVTLATIGDMIGTTVLVGIHISSVIVIIKKAQQHRHNQYHHRHNDSISLSLVVSIVIFVVPHRYNYRH